jgi:2-polyprenyl-6-methoxyphenol hydroxylase-like FAD-dependent oxidoreductase
MAELAPILIAGGGIGGLALSLALAGRGCRSIVLEARHEFAAEGAGIQLGPNGVRALQHLGVADTLHPKAGEPEALEVRDGGTSRRCRSDDGSPTGMVRPIGPCTGATCTRHS